MVRNIVGVVIALALIIGDTVFGEEQPMAREVSMNFGKFAKERGLARLSMTKFRETIDQLSGCKVRWIVRVFNCEVMTEGYTEPKTLKKDPRETRRALLMRIDLKPHISFSELAPDDRIFAASIYADSFPSKRGDAVYVEGEIWGVDPEGEWKIIYLKNCRAVSLDSEGIGELDALQADFQRLRKIPGHFGGGEWHGEVDPWGCRKQIVMGHLYSVVGGDWTKDDVASLLGLPDAVGKPGDFLFTLVKENCAGPCDEVVVYYWRGAHDFLYFQCLGQELVNSGWWMAGE